MKKIKLSIFAGISACAVLLACASANAQVSFGNLGITMDENGNSSSAPPLAISSAGLATDTDFGSGQTVLQYNFGSTLAALAPVVGALSIYDDAAHTILSDVIVFDLTKIYFMSLDNGGDMADVSSATELSVLSHLPSTAAYASVTEGANGVTVYTPQGPNGPNEQPGFMDDWTVTYTFDSRGVPDGGSTLCLMGGAILVLGALRRRLQRA